jgi:general secretion pathway protein N
VTAVQGRMLLVAAGLLAALVGLVAMFPARLALAWFAPPGLQAWGVTGTLWQGRAAELALNNRSLGSLSWDARSGSFLVLRPTYDLELRRPDGYLRTRAGFSLLSDRQQVKDLEAALELSTLPPAIVPAGVAGQVRISLQRLELERGWPTSLAGRAAVASLDLPGVILTLGPFEFVFPDQPGPPVGEIRSVGGPLAVDGRIELPEIGRWHFSADLGPGENAPRELVEGLAFVGEDIGGGRRRLVMSSEP